MPFAKLSSRLTAQLCDAKFCRCCHSLQRMTFAGYSRSYGAKKACSLQASSLLEPGRVESVLHLFPVSSFPHYHIHLL